MKTKQTPSYCDMLDEITEKFSEYAEEHADPYGYILTLLYQEREKNHYLTQRIEYLENRLRYDKTS